MKPISFGLSAVVAALVAGTAHAQTTSTSTTSVQETAPSVLDKIALSNITLLYGPSIAAPTQMYQPDANGDVDKANPVAMKNTTRLGYRVGGGVTAGGEFNMSMAPLGGGKTAALANPSIRASKGNLVSAGDYSMAGVMRYYVPITEAQADADETDPAKKKNALGSLRFDQGHGYKIADTKVSLGLDMFERVYMYSKGASGKKAFYVYGGPNISIQATDTLAVGFLYEATALSNYGDLLSFTSDGTDFEPSLSWDITSKLNATMFLDFKTGGKIKASTTTLGAALSWTLL